MYTCSKKKPAFKNLTVGKEYEGIEDGEMVVVVNDIGARARYSKEYFTGTVEAAPRRGRPRAAEAAVVAPPPPPPPPPTLEQYVSIDINRDGARINARVLARPRNNFVLGIVELRIDGSNISCGIFQVSGINGSSNLIREISRTIPAEVTGNTPEALASMIMSAMFAYIKIQQPAAYYLLSNNLNDETDVVAEWLNQNAISTCTDGNPNSGNEISLWVMSGTDGGE